MTPLEALKRIKQETAPCTYNPDFDKNKCLDIIETALKDYERRLALAKEYEDVNNVAKRLKALEIIKECFELSEQIVQNIAEWSLNGETKSRIAERLEMTPKQFDTLCAICPTLVMVMQNGRELANVIIAGSLYQTAIGGQIIRKQQVVKHYEYNENGKIIAETMEKVWVEEELPPNPILLKFIAEKQMSEKFGSENTDQNKVVEKVVKDMTAEELEHFEREINKNAKSGI